MRPTRNYHKAEKKCSDMRPVLIFIGLAVLIVMALELMKLDGTGDLGWADFMSRARLGNTSLVDPQELREVHLAYMEEGIDTGEFYAQNRIQEDKPERVSSVSEPKRRTTTPEKRQNADSRSIDDILSDITPAAGNPDRPSAFQIRKDQFRRKLQQEENTEKVENLLEDATIQPEESYEPELTIPAIPEEVEEEVAIEQKPPVKEKRAAYSNNGLKKIVIIIDDMGVSAANTTRVENLPAPLTLAYLPYAKNLPERTVKAKAKGHELMVHMPMEPMNGNIDGGPAVLKTGLDEQEFSEILEWGLSQFDDYVGLNNHMGSRLTQDRQAMERLMGEIKKRDIYFVDSVTIASSIGAEVAQEYDIPHAERDIFLDHEISKDFIRDALKKLEVVAKYKGHAIAIGHPHPETIDVLSEWLPTLKDKGFELVPASAVIYRQDQENHVVQN